MAQLSALLNLQKSSAVPNFVHTFNVLHADYLNLPRLGIDEYEYSLLPAEVKSPDDVHDPTVLPNIVIKLLKGCGQAYVRDDTCFDILRSLTLRKWHLFNQPDRQCPFISCPGDDTPLSVVGEATGERIPESLKVAEAVLTECHDVESKQTSNATNAGPVEDEKFTAVSAPEEVESAGSVLTAGNAEENSTLVADPPLPPAPYLLTFHELASTLKAEVMLVLLNTWMMSHLIKTNYIDNIEPDRLRVTPCGHDQRGNNYYYLFGIRLYKESNIKHDPLNGTGTFDWELIASDIEGFSGVFTGLKKLGVQVVSRNKALVNHLEKVIIPGLVAAFEEKHQCDLQRRMEFRRRRSVAVQQAKEKARLERQEAAALRSAIKRAKQEDPGTDSEPGPSHKRQSTEVSRAERYKRRSQLVGDEESSSNPAPTRDWTWRDKHGGCETRQAEAPEDIKDKARRLLLEWLTKQTVQWPVLPTVRNVNNNSSA